MNIKQNNEHGFLLIHIDGELLGSPEDSKLLYLAEQNLLAAGSNLVAIDISDVRYMNSTGLTILIRMLAMYRNVGGEVVLINPSISVNKVLVITKLNAIFQVLKNIEEAKQVLNHTQIDIY